VFHVRALYDTETLITNKCTKRVLSSIVTHSYMFRPCWVIFRENFWLSLLVTHSYMFWHCWVIFRENFFVIVTREPSAVRPAGRDRREFTPPVHSTQSTAHSHLTIKCNLSVTITKCSPWRWPSRVETCRSVLRLMIKLSLCVCWWLLFLFRSVPFFFHLLYSNIWRSQTSSSSARYHSRFFFVTSRVHTSAWRQAILRNNS
jgi:hypothetical protein